MYLHHDTTSFGKGRLAAAYAGIALLLVLGVLGAILHARRRRHPGPPPPEPAADRPVDPLAPVRPLPDSFPRGTHRPDVKEIEASGPIDLGSFSPGRDLVYIDDSRVWWESDHDTHDTEDDHTVYITLVKPFRRLVGMVSRRGATLKVQDTYRPTGIHNPRSLHKEGRAIDVTCDDMDLEDLAKLCWAAGFDWVLYERGRYGNGDHIHCSVRRRTDLSPRPAAEPTKKARPASGARR